MIWSTISFATAILAPLAIAAPASPTATDTLDVYAAQATAKTESPTSHVKGKVFDRYVSIWFENTDFDMAAADRKASLQPKVDGCPLILFVANFAYFAGKGQVLENLFCVTHPSEPNYMATAGGDYFGLDGDPFTAVPENVSTIVDLLEDKGISWGFYQEDMPYTGYQVSDICL
jgi:acid phosphatase